MLEQSSAFPSCGQGVGAVNRGFRSTRFTTRRRHHGPGTGWISPTTRICNGTTMSYPLARASTPEFVVG